MFRPRFLLLFALCALLFTSLARGQSSVLDKTDYGKGQNSSQDLANSLVPGKPNFTKGEKKSEVDPKTLQSKTIRDKTFEGGLNDIGVNWDGGKMGQLHDSSSTNSKSTKQSDPAAEKDPKTAKQTDTSGDKTAKAANVENKDQKSETSKPDQKSAEKEKVAAKPDGDH